MKMPTWSKLALTGAGAAMTFALLVAGCSDDKPKITNNPSDAGTDSGGGDSGGGVSCAVTAGQFPPGDCESSTNDCKPKGTCSINEATCGTKSTCLPMVDNTGKSSVDLRMRRLTVVTPEALHADFIQKAIVDQGINMNAAQCGENGEGSFNWLIHYDKTAGTITTGGAPPSADPFGTGFCFGHSKSSNGLDIAPVSVKAIVGADGKISTETIPKLNVPIYVHGKLDTVIVLPLTNATVKDVVLSADGNCIGSLNYVALDDKCVDVREDCSKWHTAGSLGGFMTLEEADNVPIVDLGNKSLCVMLTATAGGALAPDGLHCARDAGGKIAAKGDFCSTSNKAGDCQDSFWLAATFAAAAVKINDGTGQTGCSM